MDKNQIEQTLRELFTKTFGEDATTFSPLSAHASHRMMFRLSTKKNSVIGVFHAASGENEAFFYFTKIFQSLYLPVPNILAITDDNLFYIEEDLGDETLLDVIKKSKTPNLTLLKKVIKTLLAFQIKGSQVIDFDKCFPIKAFDNVSMKKDLMYFKREFLGRTNLKINDSDFESGVGELLDSLVKCESNFFLYRDFQTRNIMVKNDDPYFIDYQGGRKGALQYDVASLLFQSQAMFSDSIREELLQYYLNELESEYKKSKQDFLAYYPQFVFLRLIQVLATYGVQGLGAQKKYFLDSIPLALNNLKSLNEKNFFNGLPKYFKDLINEMLLHFNNNTLIMTKPSELTVHIFSFSFRDGKIPEDPAKNGGGYVFDCRLLPNPGRDPAFQNLTGLGPEVNHFLTGHEEVEDFFQRVYEMVILSVKSYRKRGFSDLMVNFGCTGGQHRSVYFAERLSKKLSEEGIKVQLLHTQLPVLGLSK